MQTTPPVIDGIVYGTGAISLVGSIVGLQYDALLFGLFGGLFSLMHLAPMSKLRVAGTLFSACLLGAMLSPFAPPLANWAAEWTAKVSPDIIRLSASALIGVIAQVAIPMLMRWTASQQAPGGVK